MVVVWLVFVNFSVIVLVLVLVCVFVCSLYGNVCDGCMLVVCVGSVGVVGGMIFGVVCCVVFSVLIWFFVVWFVSVGSGLLFGVWKLNVFVRLLYIVWWYVLICGFVMLKCFLRKCSVDVWLNICELI